MNPNPRLGVFLHVHHATVRLVNCLTRPAYQLGTRNSELRIQIGGWRKRGLRNFTRTWPRARLLRYWPYCDLIDEWVAAQNHNPLAKLCP